VIDFLLKKRSALLYGILFILLYGLDRISKHLALLALQKTTLAISPGFSLFLTQNYGISFSLFSATSKLETYLLIGSIMVMLLLFGRYIVLRYYQGIGIIPEVFIMAGALGNLTDRFMQGGVIDFLDFYYKGYHFPTFNFADSFIFCGVVFFLMRSMYDEHL